MLPRPCYKEFTMPFYRLRVVRLVRGFRFVLFVDQLKCGAGNPVWMFAFKSFTKDFVTCFIEGKAESVGSSLYFGESGPSV